MDRVREIDEADRRSGPPALWHHHRYFVTVLAVALIAVGVIYPTREGLLAGLVCLAAVLIAKRAFG